MEKIIENTVDVKTDVPVDTPRVTEFVVRDSQKRRVIFLDGWGKVAIFRYVDSTDADKAKVIALLRVLKAIDPEKARKFINFESDEDEFCS